MPSLEVRPMEMIVEKKILMNIWKQLLKSEDDTMDLHRIRCQTQTFGHISTTLNSLMRKKLEKLR
jgi:hypothetical protein